MSYCSWGADVVIEDQWVEAREAAKHPTMHRGAPTAENYIASNVKSAKLEKPGVRTQNDTVTKV